MNYRLESASFAIAPPKAVRRVSRQKLGTLFTFILFLLLLKLLTRSLIQLIEKQLFSMDVWGSGDSGLPPLSGWSDMELEPSPTACECLVCCGHVRFSPASLQLRGPQGQSLPEAFLALSHHYGLGLMFGFTVG